MKKIVKVLIALAIICVVAFGAYLILNNGTDNKQIYAKTKSLNEEIIVEDVNIYQKINQTIPEMLTLIQTNGYDLPDVKQDFEFYVYLLNEYQPVYNEIMKNGTFVNKVNTGKNFSDMNEAYSKLQKLYKDGYEYLSGTHYLITNPQLYNKDYIQNFHNIFKDCIMQLNKFYCNAGIAYAYGTQNLMDINNLYKLEMEYYCNLLGNQTASYIANGTIDQNIQQKTTQQKAVVLANNTDKYFLNKDGVDRLVEDKKIDKAQIIKQYLSGTAEEYISAIKDEKQKAMANDYYILILEI